MRDKENNQTRLRDEFFKRCRTIHRFHNPKTKTTVQLHGGKIRRCHFQCRPLVPRHCKSLQRPEDESTTQPQPAILRHNTDVLNRAHLCGLTQALNRPAIAGRPPLAVMNDQPSGRTQKTRLLTDVSHQTLATGIFAKTGKNFRIHLVTKAAMLYQRMPIDIGGIPRHPKKMIR